MLFVSRRRQVFGKNLGSLRFLGFLPPLGSSTFSQAELHSAKFCERGSQNRPRGYLSVYTQVRSPQEVFFNPQRLLVPLFQRPYVWNRDLQWQPLWQDVVRVAERLEREGRSATHFLGAVVLQQQITETGSLSTRTIIDGQQRLTTLQLLIDAAQKNFKALGLDDLAKQARGLVRNPDEYMKLSEDSFKVWPTNRDRSAFQAIMQDALPLGQLPNEIVSSRLLSAHSFFMTSVKDWLDEGVHFSRANSLMTTLAHHLQLVVIDLQPEEDAQEIFETLNARGTPLTAADLIKNFVFQRLQGTSAESEKAYFNYWRQFESPFWEEHVSAGRIQYSRSSLFLTQWLVAQTSEEITAREVFNRFKSFVADSNQPVAELLPKLHRSSVVYQKLMEKAQQQSGPLSTTELFLYRMSTLDSEVVKPVLLWLLDPDLEVIPNRQADKALAAIESWAIRRSILRLSTKNYNRMIVELLALMKAGARNEAGDVVQDYLASQTSPNSYWPSDSEVISVLSSEPLYRRIAKSRLRMILESLEDHRRGFTFGKEKFSEGRVLRSATSIEHLVPQDWRTNWPELDELDDFDDQTLIHQIGNLTLVTQALNSKISNSAWSEKKVALQSHSTLLMTSELIAGASRDWTAGQIPQRSRMLAEQVVAIWPVPATNKGQAVSQSGQLGNKVSVSDLIQSGYLRAGQSIFARTKSHFGKTATISEDGGIYVEGERFETLSGAARGISGAVSEAGWWFWVTNTESLESLGDLRTQFLAKLDLEGYGDEEEL